MCISTTREHLLAFVYKRSFIHDTFECERLIFMTLLESYSSDLCLQNFTGDWHVAGYTLRLISGRYGSRVKTAGTIDEINGKQNISKKKLQKKLASARF